MNATLGIDIGTYESKGVLVNADGRVLASAARPHELIVPRAGWAEHRADEDWWADFVWLSQKLLADSGLDASEVKAVGASAIGPCMLPVDVNGAPLMNAVLYGVDTRASREIEDLTAHIGADRVLSSRRQRADFAGRRPEDPMAQAQPAGHLCEGAEVPEFDIVPCPSADRPLRHRPLQRIQRRAPL